MQKAMFSVWATCLCFGLFLAGGCDPLDTCDADQFYSKGACVPCPDDASSNGSTCVCDDAKKEFSGGTCRYPKGQEPEPEADAGMSGGEDASSGSEVGSACGAYCGLLKTCIADNMTVAGLVAKVLAAAGIEDGKTKECEMTCAGDGDQPSNAAALACFVTQSEKAKCGGDQTLDGAGEALDIIDGCCSKHASSDLCKRLCSAISLNPLAQSNVPACQ